MERFEKFELGFYVNPDPETIKSQLDTLDSFGIEWLGTNGFCFWKDEHLTSKVAKIIHAGSMKLYSFHSPFGLMYPERKDLEQSLNDNRRIIDVATSWGARNIVWHARWFRSYKGDTHWADTSVMDRMERPDIDVLMTEVLPETCAYAKKFGININLENMPVFKWSVDCKDIIDFIRGQNLPNLGFIFDIGHAWCSGIDPVSVISEAGQLLNDTHFHDNIGPGKYDLKIISTQEYIHNYDMHLSPGQGTINWGDVIYALRNIKYDHPVIFETSCDEKSIRSTLQEWRNAESVNKNSYSYSQL